MDCSTQSLLKLMSTESVMPSSRLILCCPLRLLPLIPPNIRVFSNEAVLFFFLFFLFSLWLLGRGLC